MDPVTHTMTGAALAAAGWKRRTAYATPVAIVAANIPDIDVLAYVRGEYAALAFRRGWTHGPPALLLLGATIIVIALLWSRRRRGANDDAADRVRLVPLLTLVAVAIASHPLLDWMNTYGLRWLMPFDPRWYYGDSLFIIDPWIWLLLGVPLFLIHSVSTRAVVLWALFAAAASALVLGSGALPLPARLLWLVGIAAAALWRARRGRTGDTAGGPALAAAALAGTAVYVLAMVASSAAGARIAEHAATENGIVARHVLFAPSAGNPLSAGIVVQDANGYWRGTFSWRDSPRVRFAPEPVPAGTFDAVASAAARVPAARDYLTWARFPIVRTEQHGEGYTVRFSDARYIDGPGGGSLSGVSVELDAALRPRGTNDR